MATRPREAGGANERPYLPASGGHEPRQLCCPHAASNHSRMDRFRVRQFNLIVHTFFWLTSSAHLALACSANGQPQSSSGGATCLSHPCHQKTFRAPQGRHGPATGSELRKL